MAYCIVDPFVIVISSSGRAGKGRSHRRSYHDVGLHCICPLCGHDSWGRLGNEQVRSTKSMMVIFLCPSMQSDSFSEFHLLNSAVSVVASMLVSPILGPVMGFTFGATIRSKPLVILGLKNEIISVLLCLVVGCIISFLAVGFGVHQRSYPSVQMTSRGEVAGLGPAVIVALASGVATALSTLGRNSSGLVGVAISLSLLPPMVNAGLCLTYAALLNAPNIHRATGDDINYVEYGLVSFALTCINIACIFLAGTFTFWVRFDHSKPCDGQRN